MSQENVEPPTMAASAGPSCWADLTAISNDAELLEVGRQAIENELIEWRDRRLSVFRGNGLVVAEPDGTRSDVIRFGPEVALKIGLRAIVAKLAERS